MKKYLVVVLALAMVLAVSLSAMAAQGTWKSYASEGTGSLSGGTQIAHLTTSRTGPETTVAANWSVTSSNAGDYAVTKGVDYTNTVGDVWNLNDNNSIRTTDDGNTYHKTYIKPGSFDNSRGLVMARIKFNSGTSGTNSTFGVSLGNAGVHLALRGNAWRIRNGEGGAGFSDPANVDQYVYRVYAISWVGGQAKVYYSNGTDWSDNSANWTLAGSGAIPAGGTTVYDETPDDYISGIVLYTGGSSNVLDMNVSWIAQSSYDNALGEVNPWDFNPAVQVVTPEPGSILALCSGLVGIVGFARRRRA